MVVVVVVVAVVVTVAAGKILHRLAENQRNVVPIMYDWWEHLVVMSWMSRRNVVRCCYYWIQKWYFLVLPIHRWVPSILLHFHHAKLLPTIGGCDNNDGCDISVVLRETASNDR
jgi:hypothetical protein